MRMTDDNKLNLEEISKNPIEMLTEIQGMITSNLSMGFEKQEAIDDAKKYIADGVFIMFSDNLSPRNHEPSILMKAENLEKINSFANIIGQKLVEEVLSATKSINLQDPESPEQVAQSLMKTPVTLANSWNISPRSLMSKIGLSKTSVSVLNDCVKFCQLTEKGDVKAAAEVAKKALPADKNLLRG